MRKGTKGRLEDQQEVARIEAEAKATEKRLDEDHAATLIGTPRGFAALSPERRKAVAAKGGKAVQAAGTGHRYDSEAAREAGSKGGKAPHVRRGRSPVTEVSS